MRNSLLKVLVATAALLGSMEARPCTNIIISRGASQDGSVLVSYAADSHTQSAGTANGFSAINTE